MHKSLIHLSTFRIGLFEMGQLSALIRYLLMACYLTLASFTHADGPFPSTENLQDRIKVLQKNNTPAVQKQIADLSLAVKNLQTRATIQNDISQIKNQLNLAPKSLLKAQSELAALRDSRKTNPIDYSSYSIQQLLDTQEKRASDITLLQNQASELNSHILGGQTLPERNQNELTQNNLRLQSIKALMMDGKDANGDFTAEHEIQLNTELAMLDARNQYLQLQLDSSSELLELATQQHEIIKLKIEREDQLSLQIQGVLGSKRREESEKALADIDLSALAPNVQSALFDQVKKNRVLSEDLLKTTDRLNALTKENMFTKQEYDSLLQTEQTLDEQINALKGSMLLSKILYKQIESLPQTRLNKKLTHEIADIRLKQFELRQWRDQLNNPTDYATQILKDISDSSQKDATDTLLQILKQQSELLDRSLHELNSLLSTAIATQISEQQVSSITQSLKDTLAEQIFWLPSNQPINGTWLKKLPQKLLENIKKTELNPHMDVAWTGLTTHPMLFIFLSGLIVALIGMRDYIRQQLDVIKSQLGHYKNDNQSLTPKAIVFTSLLALPYALMVVFFGMAMNAGSSATSSGLSQALLQSALNIYITLTMFMLLSRDGVTVTHFHWSPNLVGTLHTQLKRLSFVLIPVIFIVALGRSSPDYLSEDALGRCILLVCFGVLTQIMWTILIKGQKEKFNEPLRMLIGFGFTLLPLILAITVILGYYYTAIRLTDRLIDTLYLLILWALIEACVVRALGVAARRLAYQRAVSKRNQKNQDVSDGVDSTEEPLLAIDQINKQSLRLIKFFLVSLFLLTMYFTWRDMIPVFSYLDRIIMYSYASGTGTDAVQVPISLGDVLGATAVIVVTLVLGRNIPGLLEVSVLSRLRLAMGTAYAMTALLSYVIFGFGFVIALSTLGVSWDKLQWLVAALSVGLGFGLQEIFGNFISGLIILFERPIRIGDTITIGSLTGIVTKIRIRATTLIDPDGKEIIVPNKTFITDQLINWTLSNTITRVIISVGVSYGTDLNLVQKLLLEAAESNPRVLKDPAPQVFFMNFGDSTLNHELRIHVREITDRTQTLDALNRKILNIFDANKIEIAFPQMDVHVKSIDPRLQLQPQTTSIPPNDLKT